MSEQNREQTPEERLDEARRAAADSALSPRSAEIEDVSDRLQTVIDAAERAAEAIRYDAEEQARSHLAEAQAKADRLTAERVGLVAQLTDDLIDHAGVVKSHSEQMVAALEEAISTVHNRLDAAEAGQLGAGAGAPPPTAGGDAPPRPPRPPAAVEAEPERIVEPLASGATVEAEVRRKTEVITDSSSPRPAAGSSTTNAPDAGGESPAAAATEASAREVEAASPPSGDRGGEPSRAMLLRATQLAVAGGSRESIGAKLRDEFGGDPTAALDRVLGGE